MLIVALEEMHAGLLERSIGFDDYQITMSPAIADRYPLGSVVILNDRCVPVTIEDVGDFIYMYSPTEDEQNEAA